MTSLTDSDVQFVDRGYGKKYVRLLHVRREGDTHYIKEIEVSSALTLDDVRDYKAGDNSQIVATDSQKNTVYILAKKFGVKSIEEFALLLSDHFLKKYDHVTATKIYIEQKPWQRIKQGGVPHNHAFIAEGGIVRCCQLTQKRYSAPVLNSGLRDMKVMKTTQSAFKNFVNDEFRSLPDMDDRIFCTVVQASWQYDSGAVTSRRINYDQSWETTQRSLLEIFAGPPDKGVYSPSVQKTLYDSALRILSLIPQVNKITIELPNVHAYEFDLKKFKSFGFTKNMEVFQPTDKPSGNIKATIERKHKARL